MASITMSHQDCTVWRINLTGISRMAAGAASIDYETPQPVMAIAAGGVSDDLYALQEDQTLLRLVRAKVETLNGEAPSQMRELSVGRDATVCALIPATPLGTDVFPYVLRGGRWEYWGAPIASAISVVDQNEAWLVSGRSVVKTNPTGRGNRNFDIPNAKWVSAASDGTVIVTTTDAVWRSTDPERLDWTRFAPLPPGSSWDGAVGPRVVCGSAGLIYASDMTHFWKWDGHSAWNAVETGQYRFYRVSVASDASIVALSQLGVVRTTTFGWELLPSLFGSPAHTNVNNIWALPPMLGGGLRVVYWAGTSWQTLEKTPVTSISVGSDDEIWGINLGADRLGALYRRNADGTWELMKKNMRAVAVGSANWVAALDQKRLVLMWDPTTRQWSEPLPMPAHVSEFENLGIGDDGTLMACGGALYLWSGQSWVKAAPKGVYELQVSSADICCGVSSGVWVSGAIPVA